MGREENGKKERVGREEGRQGRERERERLSKNNIDQREVSQPQSLKSFPPCPHGQSRTKVLATTH